MFKAHSNKFGLGIYHVLTLNVTPELFLEYFVRLTLIISNRMDGVSTLVLTTMLPLNCVLIFC